MDFNEYQQLASATMANDLPEGQAFATWALGLSGESGEVADHIKKVIGHGHRLDKDAIAKELGDILWYISAMAGQMGMSLDSIAELNIKKLRSRYPDGFSTERSLNRLN